MLKYKALRVIKSFSKEEIKEFGKFIASPYFSTGRDLVPVFTYLKKYHPGYENEKALEIEAIHKAVSGKAGKTNIDITRKLLSDLYKQAEDFVMIKELRINKYYEHVLKLKGFERKQLYTMFDKEYHLTEEYVNEKSATTEQLYACLRELQDIKINTFYEKGEQNKTNELLLKNVENIINSFYFSIISNYQFLSVNSESFENRKKSAKSQSLMKMLSYFNFKDFATGHKDPKVKIYYILFNTIYSSPDNNSVIKFKMLLRENKKLFNLFELYELYKSLAGMCITLLQRSGNDIQYNRMLFEVYRDASEANVIVNPMNEALDLLRFRNIFNTALNLKEVAWAEDFVNRYSGSLPKVHRGDAVNLARAMIEYPRKNYEKALEYINKINQSKFVFINDLKFLQLKCYYDMNYFENADSLVNSYRRYISYSETTPEEFRTYILTFLRQYQALIDLKFGFDQKKYDNLMEELRNFDSSWIYKKLTDMKHK
ncbi:MAG: hypothetical protein IT281_01315 [Ignavibacteria bacterium]|nr:hypothetical protein [Ignavibacteria bacterium]